MTRETPTAPLTVLLAEDNPDQSSESKCAQTLAIWSKSSIVAPWHGTMTGVCWFLLA